MKDKYVQLRTQLAKYIGDEVSFCYQLLDIEWEPQVRTSTVTEFLVKLQLK